MYSRETFDQIRGAARERERRDGGRLALAAVGLGCGQLGFMRWAEATLDRPRAVAAEALLFAFYALLVGWLFWRRQRNRRIGAARCPRCGALLLGLSERIAVATGRCDSCGAQVVE